jgi:hypothetical protein
VQRRGARGNLHDRQRREPVTAAASHREQGRCRE